MGSDEFRLSSVVPVNLVEGSTWARDRRRREGEGTPRHDMEDEEEELEEVAPAEPASEVVHINITV